MALKRTGEYRNVAFHITKINPETGVKVTVTPAAGESLLSFGASTITEEALATMSEADYELRLHSFYAFMKNKYAAEHATFGTQLDRASGTLHTSGSGSSSCPREL
jgi:hypothetical protein